MKLNKVTSAGTKGGCEYFLDESKTLFCDALDQSQMVGGEAEEERNSLHNPERVQRIRQLAPKGRVADFGCGSGILVAYARKHGVECFGYDPFNATFNIPLEGGTYNVVTAIEVVEHLSEPFAEFEHMFKLLAPGGYAMIESSFSDWITLKDNYCNPALGHSTIWSHRGLDEAMQSAGFLIGNHINRNVRLYRKP